MAGFSNLNSLALRLSLPAKPTNEPLAPMTRCQGITIAIGLRLLACPTARQAFSLLIAIAISW